MWSRRTRVEENDSGVGKTKESSQKKKTKTNQHERNRWQRASWGDERCVHLMAAATSCPRATNLSVNVASGCGETPPSFRPVHHGSSSREIHEQQGMPASCVLPVCCTAAAARAAAEFRGGGCCLDLHQVHRVRTWSSPIYKAGSTARDSQRPHGVRTA